MKQVQIKTGKVEMLVVDLPEGKSFSEIKICCETYYTATETTQYANSITAECISKSSKEWNYLGKSTELTEEDWKGIVDQKDKGYGVLVNKDYAKDRFTHSLFTATESGLSLLKANGVVVENSLGKEPNNNCNEYTDMFTIAKRARKHQEWQEAESKVWRNAHVFIKL